MQIGVLKSEKTPIVPLTPDLASKYLRDQFKINLEHKAGEKSLYPDGSYADAGVALVQRQQVLEGSDLILVDDFISAEEVATTRKEAIVIGKFNPLNNPHIKHLQSDLDSRLILSLDLVPRTSIAQSMDVLSSLASLSGYKAVIIAANKFSGYFPMMTTAAGTVPPARVLVLGAGVAGLQAIATAKRLGAAVEAFDVRSAVKEEVQSLGAKFIEVPGSSENGQAGGYAVGQTDEYLRKQRELVHERASKSDIIITTANIPGKKAPLLIEKRTVEAMKKGSIVVDLASASGGNCELTEDNKEIVHEGVTIVGNSRLYESLPREASRLYANNIYQYIKFILKEGRSSLPWGHEILQETLLSKVGVDLTI